MTRPISGAMSTTSTCEDSLSTVRSPFQFARLAKTAELFDETEEFPKAIPVDVPTGVGWTRSMLNFLIVGAGLRIIWAAGVVSSGGWLIGLSALTYCALISCYLLIKLAALRQNLQGNVRTYGELMMKTINPRAGAVATVLIHIALVGFQSANMLIITNRLQELSTVNIDISMLATCIGLLPGLFVKNSKTLSYMSLGGLIFSVILFTGLFTSAVRKLSSSSSTPIPTTSVLPPGSLCDIVCAISHSCMVFNLVLIAVPQMADMKRPKKFVNVAGWTFSILSCVYLITAVFSYAAFGDEIRKSRNAVKFLVEKSEIPQLKFLLSLAILAISTAQYWGAFFTQGVSIDATLISTETAMETKNVIEKPKKKVWLSVLGRIFVHFLHAIIAYPVRKDMKLLVDLIAAGPVPILVFVLPALAILKSGNPSKPEKYLLWFVVTTMTMGALAFSATAMLATVKHFTK
jgi:amino acid permease